ncbi:DUF4192 domain-containing protein [Amycolatopsis sp. CA-126428]|uniref:DUF4192 domain-containing protein n=1 Tax=Amycolatopsis sp. CA-126428 TaxID=2073158 RepID=UPI000CD3239F|nr:DUF4192 domain-containing protein [Amycolatopsis sp. CA-126428]
MPLTPASTSVIVASIPALIGFMPEDSLVLIATLTKDAGSASSGPLARIDLAHLANDPEGCARHFNRQCADLPVLRVTGVVVRSVDDGTAGDDALPLRADVDSVIAQLAEHGFVDVDVVSVPDIAEGARWRSYRDTDHTAVLPDPASTAAAAAAVAAGHTIAARRDDLAARFTPAPEALRARLHPRIAHAAESAAIDESWHLAAHVRLARADAAIRAAAHGELPADDAAIIDLAATFAVPAFREALLAVPDATTHLAAENLVLHLWRHSCDAIAAQLATAIAVYAYLRGDGTVARIALEHADAEQPLAGLLSTMLSHAVSPSKVHHVFQNASADARRTLLSEPATDQA